jgi:hypothetical protein
MRAEARATVGEEIGGALAGGPGPPAGKPAGHGPAGERGEGDGWIPVTGEVGHYLSLVYNIQDVRALHEEEKPSCREP